MKKMTAREMKEYYRNPRLQWEVFQKALAVCVKSGSPFDRWDVWAKMNRIIPIEYLPKQLNVNDIHDALASLIASGRVVAFGKDHWQGHNA